MYRGVYVCVFVRLEGSIIVNIAIIVAIAGNEAKRERWLCNTIGDIIT